LTNRNVEVIFYDTMASALFSLGMFVLRKSKYHLVLALRQHCGMALSRGTEAYVHKQVETEPSFHCYMN
jgi:hypothetical protein